MLVSNVRAEARQNAVIERQLERRHAVPHRHFDQHRDRHMRAAVAPDLPRLGAVRVGIPAGVVTDLRERFVLPAGGVDERHIRPVGAVAPIRGRVDDDLSLDFSQLPDLKCLSTLDRTLRRDFWTAERAHWGRLKAFVVRFADGESRDVAPRVKRVLRGAPIRAARSRSQTGKSRCTVFS